MSWKGVDQLIVNAMRRNDNYVEVCDLHEVLVYKTAISGSDSQKF